MRGTLCWYVRQEGATWVKVNEFDRASERLEKISQYIFPVAIFFEMRRTIFFAQMSRYLDLCVDILECDHAEGYTRNVISQFREWIPFHYCTPSCTANMVPTYCL